MKLFRNISPRHTTAGYKALQHKTKLTSSVLQLSLGI